jgi:UrcA family protein
MIPIRHLFHRGLRAIIPATFAAACLGLWSIPGHAAEVRTGVQPAQQVVRYGDLNLGSREGIDRLYLRIVAAASDVCGREDGRSLAAWARFRACSEQAIAHAVATVGSVDLADVHARKTGRRFDSRQLLTER